MTQGVGFSPHLPQVYHVLGGKDIGALLRSMGLTPSFLELRPLVGGPDAKALWPFQARSLTLSQMHMHTSVDDSACAQDFVDTFALYLKERDTLDALTTQLKSFDHEGDGMLDSDELTSALTTIGDTMTEDQVRLLIGNVGTSSRGKISIAVLAKYLLAD